MTFRSILIPWTGQIAGSGTAAETALARSDFNAMHAIDADVPISSVTKVPASQWPPMFPALQREEGVASAGHCSPISAKLNAMEGGKLCL
jgi:hypothetical protein